MAKRWKHCNLFQQNEGKSEQFIRTLKTKLDNYVTSPSKNLYFHRLSELVEECNNTIHGLIKIKPVV